MTDIVLDAAAFDALLADLEPKPCPCVCHAKPLLAPHKGWCDCDETATVPGVAVIPLPEEPTMACERCGGRGVVRKFTDFGKDTEGRSVVACECRLGRVRVDRLTFREADDHGYFRRPREVSVRVVGWADGRCEVTR